MTIFDDGSGPALYAGGYFTTSGGQTLNRIAKWDGSSWLPLSGPGGVGMDGNVDALTVFDDGSGPALYAGGDFTTAGGVRANYVAKWDGAAWSALSATIGNGTDRNVKALEVFDRDGRAVLYVGGLFMRAGGVPAQHIATWDGAGWSAIPGPPDGSDWIETLRVLDDGSGPKLYAGGSFSQIDGVLANSIAAWDGSRWSPLPGSGMAGVGTGNVYTLAQFDDGAGNAIYAGGDFLRAGGVTANSIARWDGQQWSALAGSAGVGISSGSVRSLVAYDDGLGHSLFVGGTFQIAGGRTVNQIARWSSSDWFTLSGPDATGTDGGSVRALLSWDDGRDLWLYVGGAFSGVGGLDADHIARWGCHACPPDLDGDGVLTSADFLAFQNAFDAGDLVADFDRDGDLTIFDFLAFQNAFDAGCP